MKKITCWPAIIVSSTIGLVMTSTLVWAHFDHEPVAAPAVTVVSTESAWRSEASNLGPAGMTHEQIRAAMKTDGCMDCYHPDSAMQDSVSVPSVTDSVIDGVPNFEYYLNNWKPTAENNELNIYSADFGRYSTAAVVAAESARKAGDWALRDRILNDLYDNTRLANSTIAQLMDSNARAK
jgi:hypothetical protein